MMQPYRWESGFVFYLAIWQPFWSSCLHEVNPTQSTNSRAITGSELHLETLLIRDGDDYERDGS